MSEIPDGFIKIINDFCKDIKNSFPELVENVDELLNMEEVEIFEYCKNMYANKFFDILYKNESIFNEDEINFLPNIDFKKIWVDDLSENTKEIIWKYLQLILFTVVGNII